MGAEVSSLQGGPSKDLISFLSGEIMEGDRVSNLLAFKVRSPTSEEEGETMLGYCRKIKENTEQDMFHNLSTLVGLVSHTNLSTETSQEDLCILHNGLFFIKWLLLTYPEHGGEMKGLKLIDMVLTVITSIEVRDATYHLVTEATDILRLLPSPCLTSQEVQLVTLVTTLLANIIQQKHAPVFPFGRPSSIGRSLASGLWSVVTVGLGSLEETADPSYQPLPASSCSLMLNMISTTPEVLTTLARLNDGEQVNFSDLHYVLLARPGATPLVKALLSCNAEFRRFVILGTDLSLLLGPVLKQIYEQGTETRIVEEGLDMLYVLASDEVFNQAVHSSNRPGSFNWYQERSLKTIKVGGVICLVLLRAAQQQDMQQHRARCLDILLHMSAHIRLMDFYLAERMVSSLEIQLRRHSKQERGGVVDNLAKDLVIIINNVVVRQTEHNPNLLYSLLYKRDSLVSCLEQLPAMKHFFVNIGSVLEMLGEEVRKVEELGTTEEVLNIIRRAAINIPSGIIIDVNTEIISNQVSNSEENLVSPSDKLDALELNVENYSNAEEAAGDIFRTFNERALDGPDRPHNYGEKTTLNDAAIGEEEIAVEVTQDNDKILDNHEQTLSEKMTDIGENENLPITAKDVNILDKDISVEESRGAWEIKHVEKPTDVQETRTVIEENDLVEATQVAEKKPDTKEMEIENVDGVNFVEEITDIETIQNVQNTTDDGKIKTGEEITEVEEVRTVGDTKIDKMKKNIDVTTDIGETKVVEEMSYVKDVKTLDIKEMKTVETQDIKEMKTVETQDIKGIKTVETQDIKEMKILEKTTDIKELKSVDTLDTKELSTQEETTNIEGMRTSEEMGIVRESPVDDHVETVELIADVMEGGVVEDVSVVEEDETVEEETNIEEETDIEEMKMDIEEMKTVEKKKGIEGMLTLDAEDKTVQVTTDVENMKTNEDTLVVENMQIAMEAQAVDNKNIVVGEIKTVDETTIFEEVTTEIKTSIDASLDVRTPSIIEKTAVTINVDLCKQITEGILLEDGTECEHKQIIDVMTSNEVAYDLLKEKIARCHSLEPSPVESIEFISSYLNTNKSIIFVLDSNMLQNVELDGKTKIHIKDFEIVSNETFMDYSGRQSGDSAIEKPDDTIIEEVIVVEGVNILEEITIDDEMETSAKTPVVEDINIVNEKNNENTVVVEEIKTVEDSTDAKEIANVEETIDVKKTNDVAEAKTVENTIVEDMKTVEETKDVEKTNNVEETLKETTNNEEMKTIEVTIDVEKTNTEEETANDEEMTTVKETKDVEKTNNVEETNTVEETTNDEEINIGKEAKDVQVAINIEETPNDEEIKTVEDTKDVGKTNYVEQPETIKNTAVIEKIKSVEEIPTVENITTIENTTDFVEAKTLEETPMEEKIKIVEDTTDGEILNTGEEITNVEEMKTVEDTIDVDKTNYVEQPETLEETTIDEETPTGGMMKTVGNTTDVEDIKTVKNIAVIEKIKSVEEIPTDENITTIEMTTDIVEAKTLEKTPTDKQIQNVENKPDVEVFNTGEETTNAEVMKTAEETTIDEKMKAIEETRYDEMKDILEGPAEEKPYMEETLTANNEEFEGSAAIEEPTVGLKTNYAADKETVNISFDIEKDVYEEFAKQQRLINFESTHQKKNSTKSQGAQSSPRQDPQVLTTNLCLNGYTIKFDVYGRSDQTKPKYANIIWDRASKV